MMYTVSTLLLQNVILQSTELMASAVAHYDAKRDYMAELKFEMAHAAW